MTITGTAKRVAFYCRMNHRDRDYSQFFPEIEEILSQKYGNGKWNMKVFHEIASGADPDRKKFSQLKAEIQSGLLDVVVTMKADTIARDWKQFMEFMELCEAKGVEVICTRSPENACLLFGRIKRFIQDYFEGGV